MDRRTLVKTMGFGALALLMPFSAKGKNKGQLDGCVWLMGSACNGKVETYEVFGKQLSVPMCEHHLNSHRAIMTLAHHKYDVEEILDWSEEQRLSEATKIGLISMDKI